MSCAVRRVTPGGHPLSQFSQQVFAFGLLITASTLAAFLWGLTYAPERASTMAFMTLAIAQIGHLGNARSRGPVLRLERAIANPYAIVGAIVALVLQAVAVFLEPLALLLRVVPLQPTDWICGDRLVLSSGALWTDAQTARRGPSRLM